MADWQNPNPAPTPSSGSGRGYGTGPGERWPQGAQGPRDPQPAPWPGATPQTPPGAGSPVDQARDLAQHLAGDARQQVGRRVESGLHQGKARVADTLGGVAQTLRQSGQQLPPQQQAAGPYVARAADQLQRLSDYLHHSDVDEVVGRVEEVARRQPALFLGGMFALGVLGARFLKSSQRPSGGMPQPYAPLADGRPASLYGTAGSTSGEASGSWTGNARDAQPGYGAGSAGPFGGNYGAAAGNAYDAYDTGAGRYATERDVTGSQRVASEPARPDAPRPASYDGGPIGASPTGIAGLGSEPFPRPAQGLTGPDRRMSPGTSPGMPPRTPAAPDSPQYGGERDPRGIDQP